MGFVYDFVILIPKPIQTKNITIASDTVENYKYQFDGIPQTTKNLTIESISLQLSNQYKWTAPT